MIEERVKSFIEKYNLSGKFLVAFSGGFDSMCLLDVLHKMGCEVVAIHLNHNWRGEESRQEEENCRKFAFERGIEFYSEILPDDIAQTENDARNARYEFFEKCAKKFNSKVVFTAHNYNDNAETVLYRIIKGTGTQGLQGILEHRDIYFRPLLSVSREDIEKYCLSNGLNPNKDSSNEDTKYKRNLIRKEILPLMQDINPNVIDAINSLSQIAKEDEKGENSQKYFVRQLLINNNLDYDRKRIEELSNFIEKNKTSKSGKTISLSKDLWLFVNDKEIKVVTKPEKLNLEIKVNKEGEYEFGDKIFSIEAAKQLGSYAAKNLEVQRAGGQEVRLFNDSSLSEILQSKQPDTVLSPYRPIALSPEISYTSNFPHDSEFKAYISTDKIDFTLRCRQDGDFIQPLGCKGKQKLKKYLNEKKVPKFEKDNIILLCKDKEVLWVSGYGLSEKIKVTDKPTHIIELRGK